MEGLKYFGLKKWGIIVSITAQQSWKKVEDSKEFNCGGLKTKINSLQQYPYKIICN